MHCRFCGREFTEAERSFGIDSCLECIAPSPQEIDLVAITRAQPGFWATWRTPLYVAALIGSFLVLWGSLMPWAQVVLFEPGEAGVDKTVVLAIALIAFVVAALRPAEPAGEKGRAFILAATGMSIIVLGIADVAEVLRIAGQPHQVHALAVSAGVHFGPGLFLALGGSAILVVAALAQIAATRSPDELVPSPPRS